VTSKHNTSRVKHVLELLRRIQDVTAHTMHSRCVDYIITLVSLSQLSVLLSQLSTITTGLPYSNHQAPDPDSIFSPTSCDHSVWDSTDEERGVHRVQVSCFEGQVVWTSPYGGLRVDFVPPNSLHPRASPVKSSQTSHEQFYEVCIIAVAQSTSVHLSEERQHTLQHLITLNSARPHTEHPLCLRGHMDEPFSLYIEAYTGERGDLVSEGKLRLDYDIHEVGQLHPLQSHQSLTGCRPCSESELLLSACTSDFAVVGRIHSVSDTEVTTELTEVKVSVTHLLRQRLNVVQSASQSSSSFEQQQQHLLSDNTGRQRTAFETSRYSDIANLTLRYKNVPGETFGARVEEKGHLALYTPTACRVKYGEGLFLFLGRIRLRRAHLHCAPRVSDFVRAWQAAMTHETNPCTLD